jgi:hypothetical protein
MNLPADLDLLAQQLIAVDGVRAVVLGGSRGSGSAGALSDYDIGLYYHPDAPIDVAALRALAQTLDDSHAADLVTQHGEWGPNIDGGGWLHIGGAPVDLLYRNLARVHGVIADANAGRFEWLQQAGHPFGFLSVIYMGEADTCRVLQDPHGDVAALKAGTRPYPAALRNALIVRFAWETGFTLTIARKGAARGDVSYVQGCLFRAFGAMAQRLFALNDTYCLNEKGAIARAATFARTLPQFADRVAAAHGAVSLDVAISLAAALHTELEEIENVK